MHKRLALMTVGLLIVGIPFAQADTLSFAGGASVHYLYIDGSYQGRVYYGPYQMSVNGAPPIAMVCLDGAVWFNGSANYFAGNSGIPDQVVWLVKQMISGGLSANDIAAVQLVVWDLMGGGKIFTSENTTINSLKSTWSSASYQSGISYTVYTPTDKPSQRFLVPVPEPATILLLGVGLLGVGAIGLKKRKK